MWNSFKNWFDFCNHKYNIHESYDLVRETNYSYKVGELTIYKCSLCSKLKSKRYYY